MDGLLLATVEALGHSPFVTTPAEVWERLQATKEEIGRDLIEQGSLCQNDVGGVMESEASDESTREIEWRQRELLEERLRDITDAQDRLIEGAYGLCVECDEDIGSTRLMADPAASRCFRCQQAAEREFDFRVPFRTIFVH
jgi:RNA polymerase-binding transcription factor DksA